MTKDLKDLAARFRDGYDAPAKDAIWQQHSATFRRFWSDRVLSTGTGAIPDEACDVVIRIRFPCLSFAPVNATCFCVLRVLINRFHAKCGHKADKYDDVIVDVL